MEPVKSLKNNIRYELLLEQFQLPSGDSIILNMKLKNSLNRIFTYIYQYTNIMYLEFVDNEILYNYIKFQCSSIPKNCNFVEAIKDVKNFISFLEKIKKIKNVPKVYLSLQNIHLWIDKV